VCILIDSSRRILFGRSRSRGNRTPGLADEVLRRVRIGRSGGKYLVFNWKSDALSLVKPYPVIDASVDVSRHFRWNKDPPHLLALVRIDSSNCMTWITIVEDNMQILLSYRSPDVGNLFDFEVFPCTEVLNELSRDVIFLARAFSDIEPDIVQLPALTDYC